MPRSDPAICGGALISVILGGGRYYEGVILLG